MKIKSDPRVCEIFNNYPVEVQKKMYLLRELIVKTATATEGVNEIEETLRWGEPSYLTKHGSTIRMDWKSKKPDQYALYFQCTSRLIPTFKTLFNDVFEYEANRAILFSLEDEIPSEILESCLAAALSYHKVKHLPTLGI